MYVVWKEQCHEIFDPRFFSIKTAFQGPWLSGVFAYKFEFAKKIEIFDMHAGSVTLHAN
jgi:hypothetical protein